MTTTVTGKNQITIPAALVAQLDLAPGTRIEWLPGARPDEFVCRVLPDHASVVRALRGAGRKYLKPGDPHPIDSLIAERAEEDRLRDEAL